jgi:hypothetical protein
VRCYGRNRTRRAVERTVPFGLACLSLVIVWYALHGQPTLDVAARRTRAPWYRPSTPRRLRTCLQRCAGS